MQDIKVLALDLDGTLLNDQIELSRGNETALRDAIALGIKVVVATGRVFTALPESIKCINGIDYAITSNGAHIYSLVDSQAVYDDYLREDTVEAVSEFILNKPIDVEIFLDGCAYIDENYYNKILSSGSHYRNIEYVQSTRIPVKDILSLMLEHKSSIENVNLFFDDLDYMERMRGEVLALPHSTIASSFRNNLEVGGLGTSKAKALKALLKELSLSEKNMLACGNAPNDIAMLEMAEVGVAVANGWGGVLEIADYVTASNNEDGVAQAIKKFIIDKKGI